MSSLTVTNLSFSYGNTPIFVDASISVPSGSIIGLLGPNGSGKTTFFDILCGITDISSTEIINTFQSQLYLTQSLSTPHYLRMFDIFKMTTLLCSPESITQKKALEKLKTWCPEILDRYVAIWSKKSSICSYGEKRWFFTLTLLALNSELVILDEPSAGVDAEFRHYIWKCLKGAAREGAAILVSSHNIDEITANCERFYMISDRMFKPFQSGDEFKMYYNATSLDEAFICASAKAASLEVNHT